MDELARLIVLLAVAGAALTVLGTIAIRLSDEERRIRRSLKKVLKADPHALLVARRRGRGVGFNFGSNMMAVAWDAGAWCLIYEVDELLGAELVIDGQVVARAHRGEPRKALELLTGADKLVRLRLVFDDVRHPDFTLDLWLPEDEGRKGALTAPEAVQEANRWIARTEAVVRKPLPPRREAASAPTAAEPAQTAAAAPAASDPVEEATPERPGARPATPTPTAAAKLEAELELDPGPLPPSVRPAAPSDLPLFAARDVPPWEDDPADQEAKVDSVNR
ncbi:hypothetical protein [Phenylobacterium sp.]|jgi:hypothetical protein|uniref:hypothetical protein n=1 Tax=Phenylobacterium sp. TaxID=1871053 RepID=UPI002F939C72